MRAALRRIGLTLAAVLLLVPAVAPGRASAADSSDRRLTRVQLLKGKWLQTKSLGVSPTGLVFAQNMMYRHNVTVYDGAGNLVKVIPDTVDLAAFGVAGASGLYKGSPVEVAFSPDGTKAYVSNYRMYGKGFRRSGHDACPKGRWDDSYVYRIDIATLEIDQVIPVGAVPKFLAVTPDGTRLLVSNWCTFDLSLVDTATGTETARIPLGRWPRGIAVTSDSATAYVAVMGAHKIVAIDLGTNVVTVLPYKGYTPRHLVLSPDDRYLYASYNIEHRLRKIDLVSGEIVKIYTGVQPRSMVLSEDGASLFVVNYRSGTLSKVRTADMAVVQRIRSGGVHPVGVAYDPVTHRVWVANYRGSLSVFQDT